MLRRTLSLACMVLCFATCSPPPVPAAAAPSPGPAPPAPAPFAVPDDLVLEQLPAEMPALPLHPHELGSLPPGVPEPPALCSAYATRAASSVSACADRPSALAALAAALAQPEPGARDAALAALAGCTGLPAGLGVALRAELAPPPCGDAVVESSLGVADEMRGDLYDTLVGLALAARLARTVGEPPRLDPPHSRERVEAYVAGPLGAWIGEQARAIEVLALEGQKLRYYGKAVVALEAGLADLRFVDVARGAPVPDEIAGDEESQAAYYSNLEVALDARKRRGRDATLVGLGQLAFVGVIRDARLDRARAVLHRMYGGSAVTSLDALRLPRWEPAEAESALHRVAARLPTFYATLVVEPAQAIEVSTLRMLLERGLGLPYRIALRDAPLTAAHHRLLARARLELGQASWRAVDFDEAVRHGAAIGSAERSAADELLLAVALALRGGPRNAAELMVAAPKDDIGIGDVAALDALARRQGPFAAMAALNAAVILRVARPAGASAAFWRDLATRFRDAAARLEDAIHRREAERLAEEADRTAEAITGP